MKKYEKYIIENLSEDKIKDILLNECENFLNESVMLYRGMKLDIDDYQLFQRRNNRRPKDTPEHIHLILDELFEEKFGWKARSSGIFVTPSMGDAKNYSGYISNTTQSDPYIFIPKGEYSILYNPDIIDLFAHLDYTYFYISDWYGEKYDTYFNAEMKQWDEDEYDEKYKEIHLEYEEDLREYLEDLVDGYQDYDLRYATNHINEIMFNCDEFYLFNIKYKDYIKKLFHDKI
jgi:hypothetical protein